MTDMVCEQHPWQEWPHGECLGPGMPWRNVLILLQTANDALVNISEGNGITDFHLKLGQPAFNAWFVGHLQEQATAARLPRSNSLDHNPNGPHVQRVIKRPPAAESRVTTPEAKAIIESRLPASPALDLDALESFARSVLRDDEDKGRGHYLANKVLALIATLREAQHLLDLEREAKHVADNWAEDTSQQLHQSKQRVQELEDQWHQFVVGHHEPETRALEKRVRELEEQLDSKVR